MKQVYPKTVLVQELTPIPVMEAFARIGIDLLGPLVTTVEDHWFIVVATDYLTKWVEVRPLISKDVKNIAQFVFDQVLMQHGCPLEILSDNGTEFCNVLMDVIMLQMNIKHVTTSPYHPQCNGLTERFNCTLCALLEKNGEYDDCWHEMIPAIIFAYRTNIHTSTGYSPFELLYGRKPTLPMHANLAKVVGPEPANFEQYAQTFLEWQTKRVAHAHDNIQKAQVVQKKGHDKCIRYTRQFVLGDRVAYRKDKKCEKKGKFRAQYVGPYMVFKIDEKTHKLELQLAKEGVASIDFMVPIFDVVHYALGLDLTKISLVGREVTYVPKKKTGAIAHPGQSDMEAGEEEPEGSREVDSST